ncbi:MULTISPECIES: hypothetical protein [unclassified Frankia]|uniref:hypothetical protein n=1 Tax=unclassified Frankia TaxID=2632575 RepID=UPI002AD3E2E8|nr:MULTISPECIES: hypothetical protein [unclassified Frankia]
MPTKTDRILGYLPGTFRPVAARSALRAVVDAFGGELQLGENLLAEVMQAHWVGFADRGAAEVDDLARIGALYGLLPRGDETVEQFREHLLRYVRTLLGGTVTVPGVLRVAADALGLTIEDGAQELDSWWRRPDAELVTAEADRADAATLLLGTPSLDVSGTPARRAEIHGTPDLRGGVNLRDQRFLYVVVDDGTPAVVNLSEGAGDAGAVSLEHITTRLRTRLGAGAARASGGRLVLSSPTAGPDSRLEVREGPDDAATAVLGLLPLSYRGTNETAAVLAGAVDLAAGADLTGARYLRLLADGVHLAEVDCAADDPAHTFLDHIRDAINAALGLGVASHDGRRLTLISQTLGAASTIELRRAAAQDAAERLFGVAVTTRAGQDPQPARVTGTIELRDGVDLREASQLRLRVDDVPTVTVDCAGAVPERTRLDEIVAAINSAVGADVATAVAGRLQLTSPSTGELAEVALEPVTGDAAPVLLGLPPRLAEGAAATVAHYTGGTDLSAGVVVAARYLFELAVDGGRFARIDLRGGTGEQPRLWLDDLVDRVNRALGSGSGDPGSGGSGSDGATHDGVHLVLRSRRPGGGSRLQVRPVSAERRRRFVTRAFVTGEAARTLFGVDRAGARGDDASRAAVTGTADLSHGLDLSSARYLRLAVDDAPPVDVDCAGSRPRATVLDEIVTRLNKKLLQSDDQPPVATHDGRRLTLRSPMDGPASRIAFEVPQAQDARRLLLGDAATFARGQDAGGVTFVAVTDLRGGVELPPHAALRIGVDGADAVQVALTGDEGARCSLGALASMLNVALGGSFASHDGTHLALVSPSRGPGAQLRIEAPEGEGVHDATAAVLGVTLRTYHGSDGRQARITGLADVGGPLDLRQARYLVLSVDGRPEVSVDCAAKTAYPADLTKVTALEVTAAVNTAMQAAMQPAVASFVDNRLVLESTLAGTASRVAVSAYTGGDARAVLFGPGVAPESTGLAAQPAMITGTVDLLAPADLSERSRLLLRVDGDPPREIDVAGVSPAQTTLAEVVAAIDAALPGLATATADQRLRLTSPTTGPGSRLEILPLRGLDVIEYPPAQRTLPVRWLHHGDPVILDNDGAGDASLTVRVEAPQGNGGPALIERDTGRMVALLRPLAAGDAATLWRAPDGAIRAQVESPAGAVPVPVPATELRAGHLGAWVRVPTPEKLWAGPCGVPGGGLALDNPWAPAVDQLLPRAAGLSVEVSPAQVDAGSFDSSDRPDADPVALTALLVHAEDGWRLEDAGGALLLAARPGGEVSLADHAGAVVGVVGTFHRADPPFLLVTALSRRFDVTLRPAGPAAGDEPESYPGVTIGESAVEPHSLAWQVTNGERPSRLARVRQAVKGDALLLERGRSRWQVLECAGSRLDGAVFGAARTAPDDVHAARFAGGPCRWPGIFDVSDYITGGEPVQAVFAASGPVNPPSGWVFSWLRHTPGAFEVNLPADLPARFGGRFDEARFASDPKRPELYEHVVTEPPDDDDNLVALVNARSVLLRAEPVVTLPIGFSAVTLPFRTPRHLSGGSGPNHARLYLREEGAAGFILLQARQNGPDGNLINVSARPAGPARFDVSVAADGARFESARAIVAGPAASLTGRSTIEPSPLGVNEAKAAGTRVRVTRDHSGP